MGIQSGHVATVPDAPPKPTDQKVVEEFNKKSKEYENQVNQAAKKKLEVLAEIAQIENETRRIKDLIEEKKTENTNLAYLIKKEGELNKEKARLEEVALKSLSDDLTDQLNELETSAA
jgi:septal ring factor EnvC (AmiA/AmiB activator)